MITSIAGITLPTTGSQATGNTAVFGSTSTSTAIIFGNAASASYATYAVSANQSVSASISTLANQSSQAATSSFASNSSGADSLNTYPYVGKVIYEDDFVNGRTTAGTIGVLGWTSIGSGTTSTAIAVGQEDHVGMHGAVMVATAGNTSGIVLGVSPITSYHLPIETLDSFTWIVYPSGSGFVNCYWRLGLYSMSASNVFADAGAYFEQSSSKVYAVYSDGVTVGKAQIGTAANYVWKNYTMTKQGDQLNYYVDNTLKATLAFSSSVPNHYVFMGQCASSGNTSDTFWFDYARLVYNTNR